MQTFFSVGDKYETDTGSQAVVVKVDKENRGLLRMRIKGDGVWIGEEVEEWHGCVFFLQTGKWKKTT